MTVRMENLAYACFVGVRATRILIPRLEFYSEAFGRFGKSFASCNIALQFVVFVK